MIYNKIIFLSDLQLDAGSPLVIDNKLAGIVTHISGVSRKYILFVPSVHIKRFWRLSPHADLLRRIEANYYK